MFDKTVACKLVLDPTTGLPTGVTGAEELGFLEGTIRHVTSHLTKDEVVVGVGRTLGAATVAFASATVANKMKGGDFAINPWSRG